MTSELLCYARERLLRPRILALVVLVAAAGWLGAWAGGSPAAAVSLPMALLLAMLLIVPLRLIDDLADRPVDRIRHPDRVLSRSTRPGRFAAAAVLLVVLALAMLPAMAAAGFALVVVAALARYRWRRPPDPGNPVPDRMILLKYPVCVLLIAGRADTVALWIAAIAVYAIVLLLDELDRPRPVRPR